MSHNQSRSERSDSTQYRKTGRSGSSNPHRQFSGGVSTKGGGGASSAPTSLSNSSFKKYNNNAPAGLASARGPNVDSSNLPPPRAVQNGVHQQQPTHRTSDVPVISTSSNVKATDDPTQNINRAAPTAPPSNASSAVSPSNVPTTGPESKAPITPGKAPGDASESFPLQFGSISPGTFVNGMQIPARTSSAPPNLDEQKKDQGRHRSVRPAPAIPVPSTPSQHFLKKDTGILDHPNAGEAHPVSKSKRDTQISAPSPATQGQKPSPYPNSGMPMQLPYHQPQVPVQFGGPNSQIHSQAMSVTSLQMPMPMPMPVSLPLGNSPVQHSMFIPSLQPHPMQTQGMMHQGQNLGFSPPMGPQLPPQLGSMGMNMIHQFPQQPTVNYSGTRKTVKITHPETHEELRLDSSPAPKLHPNVQSQSQPFSSFPANIPMNFYPSSYNNTSLIFPAATSVSLNSTPISQPPRLYNQVTVKPPAGSHGEKEPLPPTGSLSVGMVESSKPPRPEGGDNIFPRKETEPSSLSPLPQPKPGLGTHASDALSGPVVSRDVSHIPAPSSAFMNSLAPASASPADETKTREGLPDSVKDNPKKSGNSVQQDEVRRPSSSSLPSQLPKAENEVVEAKSTSSGSVLVSAKDSLTSASFEASNLTVGGAMEKRMGDTFKNLETEGRKNIKLMPETIGRKKHGEGIWPVLKPSKHSLETSLRSISLESPKINGKIEASPDQEVTPISGGIPEQAQIKPEESPGGCSIDVKMDGNLATTTQASGDQNAKSSVSMVALSVQNDGFSTSDAGQEPAPVSVPSPPEDALRFEKEDIDSNGDLVSPTPSSAKDKTLSDANGARSAVPRGKKKRRDLYRKAEAAGTSSDLYMAYKGPDEKIETVTSAEGSKNSSSISEKQTYADVSQENAAPYDEPAQVKVEPDDWEDAAEISTTQLETSNNENQGDNGDSYGLTIKRYSRDFFLNFVEQCTDLPVGFEVTSDIADTLMVPSGNIPRESYSSPRESHPSPRRNIDRPLGGSRPDLRGNALGDEEKWNNFPGPVMSGRGDMWTDVAYVNNIAGFRPGQGGNYGVLRNPRAQTPVHYAGGILSGPVQLGPQGGLQRNNSDSDRWQRGTGFQKGLMPSPRTPMPVMHKAEKKYEVGRVTDEEQTKQRQLKGILNKLTPQNFEKLFLQVKQVNIDNVITLSGVISQIFDKALMEPTFCEMYANFCFHLAADLPDLTVENDKITFKRLLLNKCQEEFERGEREEEEANKAEEEGEVKQTAEEREEKRLQARRRMLGNIRLIGELYKKRMLTERIMHECINKMLGQYQNPDEENIEALCKLMSTIGEMIDHPKAKEHMDAYFGIMAQLSNNMKLSSRVRFMLKDAIDLRKNKWQQRRKVEGPKKIEEVHRDAAQERHAQASRLSRVPSMGNSARRGPPMDFAPRSPSMLSSPSSQTGGSRGAPQQARGFGFQDVRMDERHSSDNRNMSVPLPQRPFGDDSITLGPQGGLARGMAFRGQQSTPSIPLAEMPSSGRLGPGHNGFGSIPERAANGQKEGYMRRYMPDRLAAAPIYDQSHTQERNITNGNREAGNADESLDRSLPTSPHARGGPPINVESLSSDKVWPEGRLRDKSVAAIKEFYSARDEHEVALCIKDLNTPSFYPSVISLWVTDSFERKDMERDLLAKLLINLTKPGDGMISEGQLIKGFESVLALLEDVINDAPKAAEFLGRIFAKVIMENVISLSKIGNLIHKGGEEQGRLVEIGLAAEVLGSILDIIKLEKGESVLNEIRSSSNLRLEDFRPAGNNKPLRIDKFV